MNNPDTRQIHYRVKGREADGCGAHPAAGYIISALCAASVTAAIIAACSLSGKSCRFSIPLPHRR